MRLATIRALRLFGPLLLVTLVAVFGTLLADEPEEDFSAELPRIPPHAPDEALSTFEVLPGFRLEQVAAEPLLTDPVSVSFDERGRMFAVEMVDYSEDDTANLGIIRLLEDTNQDGRFDRSSVYTDGLSWPTALACYDGGVFVGAAPHIYYCKDTDGDGRADQQRIVFTGFGRGNVQGLFNSFHWGLDNRIHGATSTSGGQITSPDMPDNPPVNLNGRDFAFDPRTLVIEPTSGGAQHGMSFDDWGRKFLSSNSDHIQLVMFEDRYLARNSFVPGESSRLSIAADGPQAEVFRISPVEPWRIVRTRLRVAGNVPGPIEGGGRAAGYFTGATGVTIYRGDAWPEEYRGQAFVGDVGSNIMHRKTLEPNGVELIARRADEGREFVASTDIWFRPCQFANAPDGTLYICDVYREVIEHPASLPPVIKRHLDLTSGRGMGRVYRVVPDGFRQRQLPRLDEASTAELVATLDHANGWHRDTALRLLYQRQDLEAEAVIRDTQAKTALGAMYRLHALAGIGALTGDDVLAALEHEHPGVRQHAVRLAERFLADSDSLRNKLLTMAADDDALVRYQLAFSLGEMPGPRKEAALADLARRDGGDRWQRLAILSSLAEGSGAVFARLAADGEFRSGPHARPFLESLATMIGAQNRPSELSAALKGIEGIPPEESELTFAVVRALSDGLSRAGAPLRDALAATSSGATELLDQLLAAARRDAANEELPLERRAEALRTLALDDFAAVAEVLTAALDPRQPQDVQLAALAALDRFSAPEVAPTIMAGWAGYSPRLRSAATEALFARQERIVALLDGIEAGEVAASELEPLRLQALREHTDDGLRARATELLAGATLSARLEVVEAYASALTLPGDRERGKLAFKKVCAACHKLEGEGHEIGPNLAALKNRGAETILLNVLDPNREVNPQYINYVVETEDGRSLTGMIAAETAAAVTLKRAENASDTVPRINIAEMASSRMSLMPEGMEKQVDPQALADLIAYLLSAK